MANEEQVSGPPVLQRGLPYPVPQFPFLRWAWPRCREHSPALESPLCAWENPRPVSFAPKSRNLAKPLVLSAPWASRKPGLPKRQRLEGGGSGFAGAPGGRRGHTCGWGVTRGASPRPSPTPCQPPAEPPWRVKAQHLEEGRDARGGAWRAFVWRGPLPSRHPHCSLVCHLVSAGRGLPRLGRGRWVGAHLPSCP